MNTQATKWAVAVAVVGVVMLGSVPPSGAAPVSSMTILKQAGPSSGVIDVRYRHYRGRGYYGGRGAYGGQGYYGGRGYVGYGGRSAPFAGRSGGFHSFGGGARSVSFPSHAGGFRGGGGFSGHAVSLGGSRGGGGFGGGHSMGHGHR